MSKHDWVRISIESTCANQLERCAEHCQHTAADPDRLWDAVRCGHLSAMAGMISALTGSAGVGAYDEKLAAKHLAYIEASLAAGPNDPAIPYPVERTLSYADLLVAMQDADRVEFGEPLVLTDEEVGLASALDWHRQLVDHPKPTSWSIPRQDFEDLIDFIPVIVGRVTRRNHRMAKFQQRLQKAGSAIANRDRYHSLPF